MKRFVGHGDHSEKENHRKMRILRFGLSRNGE